MQHLSKLLALSLAAPVEAALSVQLAMRDRILVEPSSAGIRKGKSCSSLDGPFCPLLGTPSDEADDGLRWRLLLRANEEDSKLRMSIADSDEHLEIPVPVQVRPQESALPQLSHKSISLDFRTLAPWISHVPHDFSQGMFRKHGLTWSGNWHVTTSSQAGRNFWTAVELTGHGSITFSRAVVVSEVLVKPMEGSLEMIGYLGDELIWRRRVLPSSQEWLNGACSLWAVDKLVFLPVGSAILGGLVAAASTSTSTSSHVTDGFLNNNNMVPVTLLSLDRPPKGGEVRWLPRRTVISPSAFSLSLREAWHAAEPSLQSHQVNMEADEVPALEDLKLVFEALEAGMELPVGVTWPLIQAESTRFQLVMAEYTDVKSIKRWWPEMWNRHQFHVLEACFLRWLDSVHSHHSPRAGTSIPQPRMILLEEAGGSGRAADGTNSATSAFFQSLLGDEAGSLLSGLVQQMSMREDSGLADELEAAISDLMESPKSSEDISVEDSSVVDDLSTATSQPLETLGDDADVSAAEPVAAKVDEVQSNARSPGFLQRRPQHVVVQALGEVSSQEAEDPEAAENSNTDFINTDLEARIAQEEHAEDGLMETAESLVADLQLLQELLQESLQQKRDMLARLTSSPYDEKP